MNDNRTLRIDSANRAAFVGKTGSGKSYLALALASSITRLIVLDPKGTIKNAKWGLTQWSKDTERRIEKGLPFRVRVPQPLDGDWEKYLWHAYKGGGCTVYIDEAYGVCLGSVPPPALTALVTRGRELGIGVWTATQRPAWVPLFLMSECEWLFVFRLQLDKDRKRIAELMGPSALNPIADKHGFYLYNAEWDNPVYYRQANILERGTK